MHSSRARARAWIVSILAASAVVMAPPSFAQFVEPEAIVLYTLTSDGAGDNYGFVAETIGDLDGDGAGEIIIGAPANGDGGNLAGKAFIYSGADGTLVHTVIGDPFNRLGQSVAGIGDADGDGVPDYAIGGPATFGGPGPQPGRLVVVSGATHTIWLDVAGPGDRTFFGYDINAAGDVNLDGHDDIIVGAPLDSSSLFFGGSAHVISGLDGSTLWSVDAPAAQVNMGAGVSGVGDQDGDGRPDQAVAIPAFGKNGGGETWVFSGIDGSLLRVLKPKQQTAGFMGNFFVHNAGDTNDDGIDDIFVGDLFDSDVGPAAGRAYVFSGGVDERRMLDGEAAGDQFGIGRGAGDIDGDGHADIVAAAWLSSAGAAQGGKTYVYSGRNGKLLRTMTGDVAGLRTGFDALAIGDVNHDGLIDFLITGVFVGGNGRAHVVAGVPGN